MALDATPLATRDRILNASNRIVLQRGSGSLTLDAVTREAGISKGGLLYHFPNKEALVRGMVEAFLARVEQDLNARVSADANPRGALARAYIASTFEPEPYLVEVSAGTLAAVATDPELLAPLQAWSGSFQVRLEEDGVDPTLATLIRLAVDGLYFNDLFGLGPSDNHRRQALRLKLYELVEQGL